MNNNKNSRTIRTTRCGTAQHGTALLETADMMELRRKKSAKNNTTKINSNINSIYATTIVRYKRFALTAIEILLYLTAERYSYVRALRRL